MTTISHQNCSAIALYQPDMAQNVGAVMRLCACLAMPLHIIEPCGFPFDDRRLRRVGMDYIAQTELIRHTSWEKFYHWTREQQRRLLLLTTKASTPYWDNNFSTRDILLFGRESAGVPEAVHQQVDQRLTIPMAGGARSLNLATSAAIVGGEAHRQLLQST